MAGETVHLVQGFDRPTTFCCDRLLADLGADDLLTRMVGKTTCPQYRPIIRAWLNGNVVDGAALAHEVWALATLLGWQPETDTIVANVHELAGWLDACLDSAGLATAHSLTWLQEWQHADRARRSGALPMPPVLVHGALASRSWAADTPTEPPSTSDTQHYQTGPAGGAPFVERLAAALQPHAHVTPPVVTRPAQGILLSVLTDLRDDPDWAHLGADQARELATLLAAGLARRAWLIVPHDQLPAGVLEWPAELDTSRHRDGCARGAKGDELWWDPACGACRVAAASSGTHWHAGSGRWVPSGDRPHPMAT